MQALNAMEAEEELGTVSPRLRGRIGGVAFIIDELLGTRPVLLVSSFRLALRFPQNVSTCPDLTLKVRLCVSRFLFGRVL
jgi:hypothetical protein